MTATTDLIEQLTAEWEPRVREAFLAAVRELTDGADVARILAALEVGDVEAALAAFHVDDAVFQPMAEVVRQAYGAAGVASAPRLRAPGGEVLRVRFDVRHLRAEDWLRRHSARLVRAIAEDQRVAIRETLQDNLARGRNPRAAVAAVVGRHDPRAGRRVGGVVGLTAAQARYVSAAREELSDPAGLRRYLARQRRDRRFDATVRRALERGEGLPASVADKLAARYADRLLALRGEAIARTETMGAINAARDEAHRQAADAGSASPLAVRKVWRSAGDRRVRHNHREVSGDSVGIDERFANGLLHPHELGAPAREVVMCRCHLDYRVDWFANVPGMGAQP